MVVRLQRYFYNFRIELFIFILGSIVLSSCVQEEVQQPLKKKTVSPQAPDIEYQLEESFFVFIQAIHQAQGIANQTKVPVGIILQGKNEQGRILIYEINLDKAWKESIHIRRELANYQLLPEITFTREKRHLWCYPQGGGIDFPEEDKNMHANTTPPQADIYITHKNLNHHQLGLINLVKKEVQVQTYVYER